MFGRSNSPDQTIPRPPVSPAPAPNGTATAAPKGSPFGPPSTMGSSIIGTDLTILGEKITIISQNRVQIDGDVRGDVNGKQVIIGDEGSVIGTVCAEAIEVRGGVRGAIKAQSVTLHPTAVVEGDITHQTLAISEGAQFDGRVRRAKDGGELRPNLDVNSYASPAAPQSSG